MKTKYEEKIFDINFLSNVENWPKDMYGVRVCRLKSRDSKSSKQFGVVYEDEPLKVYEVRIRVTDVPTWKEETFATIEELTDAWMVD